MTLKIRRIRHHLTVIASCSVTIRVIAINLTNMSAENAYLDQIIDQFPSQLA